MDIIKDCQAYFNLKLPSELLSRRYEKLLLKISFSNNTISIVALLFEL